METETTTPRILRPMPSTDGSMCYVHNLTRKERTDLVEIRIEIANTLPIVFVPGIMGSNLRSRDKRMKVWRLDTTDIPFVGDLPIKLALQKMGQKAGKRQELLHPDRTEVDPDGKVPDTFPGSVRDSKQYQDRGWGEIGSGSYHAFLLLLEKLLNSHRSGHSKEAVQAQVAKLMQKRSGDDSDWRPQKPMAEPEDKDWDALRDWFMPVYACGYNWLDDNATAASRLKARIEEIIESNNHAASRCQQVIVVTHSMGGLVARACQQLDGMQDKIAGVVHGVMPANGAAVAYRRCKVGMREEDFGASIVIGKTGQEVTAVFAQAPGALELLPTQHYDRNWLEVRDAEGKTVQKALHESDPYNEIYQRRDRWWALIKEEWLAPKGGAPIDWTEYLEFLRLAKAFHLQVTPDTYHPNTYAFYGADTKGATKSFERVVWQMKRPDRPSTERAPAPGRVYEMSVQEVDMDGVNPEHVGLETVVETDLHGRDSVRKTSQWELHAGMQDAPGDGTVPALSGRAPTDCAKVRQVFRLSGVEHEPAFRESVTAQQVTVYAISRIALEAVVPQAASRGSDGKAGLSQ